MVESEVDDTMGKDRRGAIDIVRLLAEALSEEEQLLYALSEETDLDHGTIERYLKLLVEIQELFKGKTVHYKEQQIGKKTYKSAWITNEDE